MKSTLLLVLGLCTVMSTANAQYGNNGGMPRDQYPRDNKYVDSDALENQAIQKLENALKALKTEIQTNNNYGYGTTNRGNARGADLLTIVMSMENSSWSLRNMVKGDRNRRNLPMIKNELTAMNQNAFNLINAIPLLSRTSANLIDNIFSVAKAVGAVELALNAPTVDFPGNNGGNNNNNGGYNGGHGRPQLGKGGYCSLSFRNPYNDILMASGDGMTVSDAMASLYANCAKVGGSASNWTNAQVCQSKVAEAKCVDGYEMAEQQNAYSRFASCSMNFRNPYNDSFVTSGAGANFVVALANLWDSCNGIGGRAAGWTNAEVCRQAVASKTFTCVVR